MTDQEKRDLEVEKITAKRLLQDFLGLCNMDGMTVDLIKKHIIIMAKVIGVEVEE